MEFIAHFRRLTPVQRNTFIACFLGWSLDAFDFFILTFCVSAIATQFQTKVSAVAEAIFLPISPRIRRYPSRMATVVPRSGRPATLTPLLLRRRPIHDP